MAMSMIDREKFSLKMFAGLLVAGVLLAWAASAFFFGRSRDTTSGPSTTRTVAQMSSGGAVASNNPGLPAAISRSTPLAASAASTIVASRNEPATKSVKQTLGELASQANSGDASAAYEYYKLANRCFWIDGEIKALSSNPSSTDHVRADIEKAKEVQKACASVTPRDLYDRNRFLLMAAEKGNLQAKVDYFRSGPTGDPNELSQRPSDPMVVEWQTRAKELLVQAAEAGNYDALSVAADALSSGDILPRDYQKGLAYHYAISAINESRSRRPSRLQLEYIQGIEKNLKPQEIQDAKTLGAKIAELAKKTQNRGS